MSSALRGSDTLTDNSTHTSRVYNVCMYIKKQEVLGLSMDGLVRKVDRGAGQIQIASLCMHLAGPQLTASMYYVCS